MADVENVVREAQTVVTSSNAEAYYAEKLGLASEPETEAVVEEPTEPEAVEAEPEAEEQAEPQEKPVKTDKVKMRFDKVSKQAQEAVARAEALENELRELKARVEPTPQDIKPPVAEGKPQASQFNDPFEYAEALAEWSAENALKARDAQEAQRKAQAEQEVLQKSWVAKVEKAKEGMPDFDEVVSSADVQMDNTILRAIIKSDVGAQLLYQLASDEDYAMQIAQMPVEDALRTIGKLEAKLEASLDKPKTAPKTVARSKAPEPIKPITGGKTASMESSVDSDGEFHGTYAQWKAARQAGKLR